MVALLVFPLLFLLSASDVQAQNVPTFPSCSNPSGEIKVEYVSGLHAIVGESALREGKDTVYSLFDGNMLQCFCPEDGAGVQTNWWKLTQLSQGEINSLKAQGWHFIPSGADWGLTSDPYLAKNSDYYCKSNGGGEGGGKGAGDPGVGGGTSDSVLGLAATGGNSDYIAYISLGMVLVAGGLLLKKRTNG